MSAPQNMDFRAWMQELKSNRRTQAALIVFIGGLTFAFWPDSPKPKRTAGGARVANVTSDDRQTQSLRRLPDLAKLDKAGELPKEKEMARDLFLFDGPPPPPPPPTPPPPPPPPPTEAEQAARRLQAQKDAELAAKPSNLRYLGFLGSDASGRIAAFVKAEEPLTMKVGDLANPQWRLVAISDLRAEFENLKYPELRHRIEATDTGGSGTRGGSNDF